jgi:hypothetical protein
MLAGCWLRIRSSMDIIARVEDNLPYLYRRNPAAARLCRWCWKTWLRHTQWRNLQVSAFIRWRCSGKDRDHLRPVIVETNQALSVGENRTTIMIKDCRIRSRKVSLKEVERPTIVAREQKLTKGGRRKVGVVDVNRRIRKCEACEALSQLFRRVGIAFDPDKP